MHEEEQEGRVQHGLSQIESAPRQIENEGGGKARNRDQSDGLEFHVASFRDTIPDVR
jgi:hypothetical protein